MRSRRRTRNPARPRRRGVALLETLIAFALLAAFSVLVLRTLSGDLASQSSRENAYWLAEFLRSKAEEFAALPYTDLEDGTEDGSWHWSLTTRRVWPDGKSRFDGEIALIELTIRAWHVDRPDEVATAATIVVRRP